MGMIGRRNRSTRRKPAPVPLCPPHKKLQGDQRSEVKPPGETPFAVKYKYKPPYAARTRTRAAAVGSRRLTAWATARPRLYLVAEVDNLLQPRNISHLITYNFSNFRSWIWDSVHQKLSSRMNFRDFPWLLELNTLCHLGIYHSLLLTIGGTR
jgi:hypothetical protein